MVEVVEGRGVPARRGRVWISLAAVGALLILMGVFAIGSAFFAGLATILVIGVLLVAAGIAEIIEAFQTRHRGGFWTTFLAGVLSAAVGGLLIARPVAGLAATTVLLGALFVALGLFRIATSAARRYEHWGWDLAYGIVVLALGGFVLLGWPVSALWLLGTLVGVELISRGIAWLGVGMALRSVTHRPRHLRPA